MSVDKKKRSISLVHSAVIHSISVNHSPNPNPNPNPTNANPIPINHNPNHYPYISLLSVQGYLSKKEVSVF